MEKYRRFADPGSGINPFIPSNTKASPAVLRYTLGLVLFLIRLPLLIATLIGLAFYEGIFRKAMASKTLRRSLDNTIHMISYGMLLLIFGFFSVEKKIKTFKKTAKAGKSIILCNHTHPLDLLYLAFTFSPTFVRTINRTKSPTEKDIVLEPLGFLHTLKYFFVRDYNIPLETTDKEKVQNFTEVKTLATSILKNKQGPLVILYEGTLTNGKGVLAINEGLAGDLYDYQKENDAQTMLISIQHKDTAQALVSSPILSTLSLLLNVTNSMTVTINNLTTLPMQRKDMAKSIHEAYELGHQLVKLVLTPQDYKGFIKYWNDTQKKDYVSKKE